MLDAQSSDGATLSLYTLLIVDQLKIGSDKDPF